MTPTKHIKLLDDGKSNFTLFYFYNKEIKNKNVITK